MSDALSVAKPPGTVSDATMHRYVWWDVFYAVSGIAAAVFSLDGDDAVERVLTVLLVLAMAVWYAATGRRLILRRISGGRYQYVYVGGLVLLYLPFAIINDSASLMLMPLSAMVFWLGAQRIAIPAMVLLNLSTIVGAAVAGRELVPQLLISAAIMASSLMLGTWVNQIIVQNLLRADLIAELEASREEVARLSMEAGIATERQRLAADIHDTLAQGFGSVVMLAQAVRRSMERDPSLVDEQLDLIEQTARDNLAEARAIVTDLQPIALESATVEEAIRRLAGDAKLSVAGSPRQVPPPVAVVLLRSCQEALTNARKHAKADNVYIGLTFEEERVTLSVRDDGVGFDTEEQAVGFGLSGMRGRATEVGGELTVNSRIGEGTTVFLAVPA